MIIKTLEELEPYRQLTVRDDVKPKTGPKAARAYSDLLETEELVRILHGENLPYYITRQHQIENKSINQLAAEMGLGPCYLAQKMHALGIPLLTRHEATTRNIEFGVGVHGLSHEELQANGENAYKLGIGVHGLSHEELQANGSIGGRKTVELHVGIHGLSAEERLKINRAAGTKAHELGVGFHSLSAEEHKAAGRKSYELGVGVHDPEKRNAFLPTIHGRRIDVPYDAKSAYEANIYRLLTYLGFQVEHDVPVELSVDERGGEMFKFPDTIFRVDFLALSSTGRECWYEICAHPYEDPVGLEKILMFNKQYPERKMIVVTGSQFDSSTFPVSTIRYRALENAFAAAINQSAQFAGWERKGYNLKTHPEVFGPRD